jgi:hypothetical protein
MRFNHIKSAYFGCYGKFLLPVFLLTVFYPCIFAQETQHRIECLARVKEDTIVLRWVPASIPAWQTGNKYGYVIHRYTISRNGEMLPDGLTNGELLTPQPIQPAPESVFESLSAGMPEAGIVQEAIYGKDFRMPDPENGFIPFLKSYRELEARFGFSLFVCDLSPKIAEAAGLYYADANIRTGERYAYRIAPAQQPQGLEIRPAVKVVDAGQPDVIPVPDELLTLPGDQAITLRWPVMLHQGIFTAYILEKSADGKTFLPVSDLPLVTASETDDPGYFIYRDSLERNGETFHYRVRGLTPFGERSRPSATVSSMAAADFTAYAVVDTVAVTGENRVDIGWRVTETSSGQVKNITVQRAPAAGGPYTDLARLPANTRKYTDSKAAANNYYRVMLEGGEDLRSYSFPYYMPLEDSRPPEPPHHITGTVDSAGIVTLAWQANTEPDLLGYRVFRANALHEEFVEITRQATGSAVYHDTINLNTLTRNIFYRLTAVDRRYNNSEYSEPVRLTRPDTIPPAPAVFTMLEVKGAGVEMTWETSPSNDVAGYALYRTGHDSIRTKLAEWTADRQPGKYADMQGTGGYSAYTLETTDHGGNTSHHSRTCYIRPSADTQIGLHVRQEKNRVFLNWQLPQDMKAKDVTVYRAVADEPLTTYMQATAAELSTVDGETEPGKEYSYRVKVAFRNGQTAISEVKKIKVK